MDHLSPLDPPLRVVLHQPEIPPNTGNVARMCACTGARLHLVEPLGFKVDDRHLKRAGLDYWDKVHVATWSSWEALIEAHPGVRFHLFTSSAERTLWDARFEPGDLLVFGSESVGLPRGLLDRHPERLLRLPMLPGRRSLNLSATAAVAVYEALRQITGGGHARTQGRGAD